MIVRLAAFLSLSCAAMSAAASYPSLVYSTYLRDHFTPTAIATDTSGNIYVAGNALVDPPSGLTTVLVLKLNPSAGAYVYTRFIGGSVNDSVAAIAVDGAGNAYIAGVTNSPDFPVTDTSAGTAPGASQERSYVAKLNAAGELVYSMFLGGSANTFAQALAVNASGQAVVSGTNVSGATQAPYLTEVNASGTAVVFSSNQIGGSALAIDAAGNIYIAGTTGSLAYPLTPGTYQPTFPMFLTCIAPCTGSFQGPNQYVTKTDPAGNIIWSTAVSGTGNTANNGIAVDAAGNVYLTGVAGSGYPYTVPAPTPPNGPAISKLQTPALPFLTKLDPNGANVLYSAPVGGAGVALDANGNAYVGGVLGSFGLYDVDVTTTLANVPAGCFGTVQTVGQSAYVAHVDASGNVTGAQFIGGSTLTLTGVALAQNQMWVTGRTQKADFPFTPGALASENLQIAPLPGAYLGAVNFAATPPTAGTPQIACIVDSAELLPTGPLAPNQLITIFGNGLGATGVPLNDTTTSLGGTSVTFGNTAAALLYVSANQINVAVPRVSAGLATVMTVTVNGAASAQLQFPVVMENPTLFDVPGSFSFEFEGYSAVALNADGSFNSANNPAKPGSIINVFAEGLPANAQLLANGKFTVTGVTQATPFTEEVSLQIPSSGDFFACPAPNATACVATISVVDLSTYLQGQFPGGTGGVGFSGNVYVAPQ